MTTIEVMRAVGVMAMALLLATACSAGDEPTADAATASAEAQTEGGSDPQPTGTTEPELAPTPPSVATPEPADAEGAVAAWTNFWVAVSVPDDDAAGLTAALDWGTQAAVDSVRSFPWGSTDRDVANYPVPVEQGDGMFVIDDCMFHTPGFSGAGAVWWTGTVTLDDTGDWQVSSAERVSHFDPCVPAEIAEAAIAGYEAYWDAQIEYWDPPDPDSPLIDETTTGIHRDLVIDRLAESVTNGWSLRGRPSIFPEVSGALSPGSLIIDDCAEQSSERGVFDSRSGERLDDLMEPILPAQQDFMSVLMELDGDNWKVAELRLNANEQCLTAPTDRALPAI